MNQYLQERKVLENLRKSYQSEYSWSKGNNVPRENITTKITINAV